MRRKTHPGTSLYTIASRGSRFNGDGSAGAADDLLAGAPLERQLHVRQEIFDLGHEAFHRVELGCAPQVSCRRVQIDLRAADTTVTEQIADRDQAHALVDEVGRKGVPLMPSSA